MTVATDEFRSVKDQRRMTLKEYLDYDDGTDTRYELVDGVLVEMGAESPLNPAIAMFLVFAFARLGVPEENLIIGHQVGVSSSRATARQPDLIVHSDESRAAIFDDGKLLRTGLSAPLLVVEVASNSISDKISRERDYDDKPVEYAARLIPEYWLIDPDRAWVMVGTLVSGTYQFVTFQGNDAIVSSTFPDLTLTAAQILKARR
ncbi:MAG: Uma2 family endonuclease [Cyanobacteria bacterium]|nr:Uma2 family endonuclease [Cyanobacteriota bacterium]